MDVVLAVVREIVVLQPPVSQREQEYSSGTDDDIAYILDVFHQEANVELGV